MHGALKVLSSEMDQAEIRLIRFLEKSARPPSCDSPLKSPSDLIQKLRIRHLMDK
jgi:hypothetical protein